mmetsp:Transcript_98265/g.225571  ORF Transcript_98265/g.225571 Transcript_98265/m.225571 type:complete len:131 (-) Transcript_98265:987-1379(-)
MRNPDKTSCLVSVLIRVGFDEGTFRFAEISHCLAGINRLAERPGTGAAKERESTGRLPQRGSPPALTVATPESGTNTVSNELKYRLLLQKMNLFFCGMHIDINVGATEGQRQKHPRVLPSRQQFFVHIFN